MYIRPREKFIAYHLKSNGVGRKQRSYIDHEDESSGSEDILSQRTQVSILEITNRKRGPNRNESSDSQETGANTVSNNENPRERDPYLVVSPVATAY